MMTLEGNLRELALAEVCQLLAHTRKSGDLHISAPLSGLSAVLTFQLGAITGASIEGHTLVAIGAAPVRLQDAQQAVESTTFELLTWTEGTFQFVPADEGQRTRNVSVRLHTELILMESARRAAEWTRLSDRIPHVRVVPAFAEVEPRQLPLLNLAPQQWELLTSVDGHRDLSAIARSLGRDLLEVAEVVHGLLGTGLVRLVDVVPATRRQATPPSNAARTPDSPMDLWIPSLDGDDARSNDAADEIFDPILVGVLTPEGLPRLRTPAYPGSGWVSQLRQLGDEAARAGDLAQALTHWRAVIACEIEGADLSYCREVADLTERLLVKLGVPVPS